VTEAEPASRAVAARNRIERSESDELTIGEAAARIGVATSTLRFYESKGLIVSRRTDGGQRRYARDVLRRVAFVRAAQSVGLSLEEIAAGLAQLPRDRAPSRQEWAEFATQWRPRLDEQIATLEAIRDRLAACIGCGCLSLDVCRLFNPGDQAAAEGGGAPYLLRADDDNAG
jgi:MerR family redox-sensitive transcriptional activator SoxR